MIYTKVFYLPRCVKFHYAMAGVTVSALRLIRVDIDTGEISDDSSNTTETSPQEIYSRNIETSLGFGIGAVKV